MSTQSTLIERTLDDPDDFLRIRGFLADGHPITPCGLLWDVRMWDGAWHTGARPGDDADRRARMRIFEDRTGRIVAALLSQGGGAIHPQVHPARRNIESALISRGEALVANRGESFASILCWEYDDHRTRVLEQAGYARSERSANIYRIGLDATANRLTSTPPPTGYTLRPTRPDDTDRRRLAELLNAGFDRTRHHAGELRVLQEHAPSFRRDLDLVAESNDGTLAAYAAVCWDDANQRGIYEPVCTHPDHRRRGLARALMLAGLHRARAQGARSLEVPTGDAPPANALYRSMGAVESHHGWFWTKRLDTA